MLVFLVPDIQSPTHPTNLGMTLNQGTYLTILFLLNEVLDVEPYRFFLPSMLLVHQAYVGESP